MTSHPADEWWRKLLAQGSAEPMLASAVSGLLGALLPFLATRPSSTLASTTIAGSAAQGGRTASMTDTSGHGPSRPTARAADKSGSAPPICAGCHRHLTAADLDSPAVSSSRGSGNGSKGGGGGSGGVLECAGCHRCYHGCCHRRWAAAEANAREQQARRWGRGGEGQPGQQQREQPQQRQQQQRSQQQQAAAADGEEEPWFHNGECWQVHRALQRLCRSGDITIPGDGAAAPYSVGPPRQEEQGKQEHGQASPSSSYSSPSPSSLSSLSPPSASSSPTSSASTPEDLALRIYDCRAGGPATAAGLRRVHGVLRQEFGYSLADLRQFDYAALLTRGSAAVSAAIVDVYGADFAELYLMATCTALQRQGYGRVLVRQLEGSLGGAGVRQLLVSVDDDDTDSQSLWRDRMSFAPLTGPELQQLGRSFGEFGPSAARGTVFMCRPLVGGGEARQKG